MVLNLQGHLWFIRASYAHGCKPKKASAVIFIAIVLLHLALIVIALNAKLKQRETETAPSFKMIYLSQEKSPVQTELTIPDIERASIKASVVLPEIILEEQTMQALTLDYSPSTYQLPSANDGKYGNVFDPKMRQKLLDAQGLNKPRAKEKLTSWTESDGRVFTYMGDGKCFVTMPKTDSRQRGQSWGMTRCGKTDSEKMMDSVNADFESRRGPLKLP